MKILKKVHWLCLPLLVVSCSPAEQEKPTQSAIEVGYVTVKSQAVPYSIDLRGRVVALATAEVRPQVDGIVRKVAFTEGREVKAGDILYEIDGRKFAAALAAAEAALTKAQAATASAQTTYDRNKTLAETKAVSTQTVDDAQSTLLQAKASQEAAKADVETARINLENATIKAPISGMIGVSSVSVGALVTENQTDALATIRQIQPVHVDLVDTSVNMLRIRDEVETGKLDRPQGLAMSATLTLETGKVYGQKGQVSLADMVVGETTGTFTVRATFENPDRVLVPGMFVTANVQFGTLSKAYLIPQRALTRADDGRATVYLVSEDNKAKLSNVTTNGSVDNDWIVIDGVKEGDRLIVDGFQKISDGAAIQPVEATIDSDGVVKQDMKTAVGVKAEESK